MNRESDLWKFDRFSYIDWSELGRVVFVARQQQGGLCLHSCSGPAAGNLTCAAPASLSPLPFSWGMSAAFSKWGAVLGPGSWKIRSCFFTAAGRQERGRRCSDRNQKLWRKEILFRSVAKLSAFCYILVLYRACGVLVSQNPTVLCSWHFVSECSPEVPLPPPFAETGRP